MQQKEKCELSDSEVLKRLVRMFYIDRVRLTGEQSVQFGRIEGFSIGQEDEELEEALLLRLGPS